MHNYENVKCLGDIVGNLSYPDQTALNHRFMKIKVIQKGHQNIIEKTPCE